MSNIFETENAISSTGREEKTSRNPHIFNPGSHISFQSVIIKKWLNSN
jgi:hypothetical protein